MNAFHAAVAYVERELRDQQAEGRKEVQKAVTDLVQRFRSNDPVQRAEQVRRFHHVLLPQVQDLVLDKLIADSLHGSASLKARSIRVLQEIGARAVSHLHARLARSPKTGHRLRLLELLAAVAPASEFVNFVALSEAEFGTAREPSVASTPLLATSVNIGPPASDERVCRSATIALQ